MDWEQAAGFYKNRLEQTRDVLRHALYLSRMPQVGILQEHKKSLEEADKPSKLQLERLKKREFRIAVVGCEKAGKSTFVNAWLEKDLLPNDSERCTFSTTQIHSVINDSEQRLEVKSKTEETFKRMIDELEKKAQGGSEEAKRAQKDLETIRKNKLTLQSVIETGDQTIPFERLEDIEDNLKKYVADERYAHSVQEVRIYTSRLAAADGIIFFDVPGLDSGLDKHLEESEGMLKDCDAVICLQKSDLPSLRAGEQKLIEFIKTGDKDVNLEDKLFVFLGYIDKQGSTESLRNNIEKAISEWKKYGLHKSERVVPGSAAAYLLHKGVAGKKLLINVGSAEEVLSKLIRVTEKSQAEIEIATGIPVIKGQIDRYLRTERVGVLKKRCDGLIERIINPSRAIYKQAADKYPENIEDAKKNEDEKRMERLLEWWRKKWDEIQRELGEYYNKLCNQETQKDTVDSFRERYISLIQKEMKNLPSRSEKRREDLFGPMIEGFDPQYANFKWREKLHLDAIEMIEEVAKDLSDEILKESDELIMKMSELLWDADINKISSKIIDSRKELHDRLFHGLRTLFLRFARPVAKVLIAAPHGSQQRIEIIKELGADMELLDVYYEGRESAYQCLKKFAKYGRELLVDAVLRDKILGIPASIAGSTAISIVSSVADKISESSKDMGKAEMIEEVETDLNALEEYLREAVFSAAGFVAYRKQELYNLCKRFFDKEYSWIHLIQTEFLSGNEKLLAQVPEECKGTTYDTEVCERLKQLRIALDNFKTSLF